MLRKGSFTKRASKPLLQKKREQKGLNGLERGEKKRSLTLSYPKEGWLVEWRVGPSTIKGGGRR